MWSHGKNKDFLAGFVLFILKGHLCAPNPCNHSVRDKSPFCRDFSGYILSFQEYCKLAMPTLFAELG
jgi:hypothetical protein